ncbi:hypothetical protein H7J08_02195 [Mycobacterium frederiksbergense]|uniref:Glycosyltransferase 2-like domain-containing protein n=1 Tax=Mycolicibacterium frederiksbergense TaxID=117567 RepID=A0A6H0S7X5_9MYCO|nr:hypothetical protein [Mycolicibacterium frederiksbergense]MCV7043489.1 hypothetical protein [Mycolicibacterium frederiksbergense]QIV83266.1 hypothetical protein EXE63_22065 [Mycolicibacterium frederiksbergense]
MWDKGTKVGIGLIAAREFGPEYVMQVDADDFVHRDLVSFVNSHHGHPGWVLKRGVMYSPPATATRCSANCSASAVASSSLL